MPAVPSNALEAELLELREEREALLELKREKEAREQAEAKAAMARTRSAEKASELAAAKAELARLQAMKGPLKTAVEGLPLGIANQGQAKAALLSRLQG